MSRRGEEDLILIGISGTLAVLALACIVFGIVLFTKKRYVWGAVVTTLALICIATAIFLGGITLLSQFAWH